MNQNKHYQYNTAFKNQEEVNVPFQQRFNKDNYISALNNYDEIALLLSGGGSLGSYQAGVLEGFIQADIEPTWIAGISIGALNAAIFAGNPPEKRLEMLHKFWNTICTPPLLPSTSHYFMNFFNQLNDFNRVLGNNFEGIRSILEGKQGFFTPRFPIPLSSIKLNPEQISFYDISKLKQTLIECADFELINKGKIRISVGAVNISSGEFVYFDNTKETLQPEHFMASGAAPPSFPAVEINGQYYWDGSLMSNTPLTEVLKENGHLNKLIYQVDLWHSESNLPNNIQDVLERKKDLDSSGKTKLVTDLLTKEHINAHVISELLSHIPEEEFKDKDLYKLAKSISKPGLINIVQIIYKNTNYEGYTKDYDFSFNNMKNHWSIGLNDMKNILSHTEWLELKNTEKGFVMHELYKNSDK